MTGGDCTVSRVFPVLPPSVTKRVALPAESAVTIPLELTLATVGFDEVQLTWLERFCWLPSENVPVAANCFDVPLGSVGFPGAIAMEVSAGPPPGWNTTSTQ